MPWSVNIREVCMGAACFAIHSLAMINTTGENRWHNTISTTMLRWK